MSEILSSRYGLCQPVNVARAQANGFGEVKVALSSAPEVPGDPHEARLPGQVIRCVQADQPHAPMQKSPTAP